MSLLKTTEGQMKRWTAILVLALWPCVGTRAAFDGRGQATPGNDATLVTAVQGVTGGKAISVSFSGTSDVNIIQLGSVAIGVGSGVVTLGTLRVVLATDVPLPAGTNAIGKLTVNDGVDIGDVTINNAVGASAVNIQDGGNSITIDNADLTSLGGTVSGSEQQVDVVTDPPLVATTDTVGSTDRTDKMLDVATEVTPKFAIIDAASSGDNTLVAAVSGKKIRVVSLVLVASGAVNTRFESGAAGTALSGQMNLTTNSGFSLPYNPVGWFETGTNVLLNLELSGATSVDGMLTYIEVD